MVPTSVTPDATPPPSPSPPSSARRTGARIAFLLLFAGLLAVIGFVTWQGTQRATASDPSAMLGAGGSDGTITIAVDGMSCVGCAGAVETTLEEVPGVAEATVDYDHRTARIRLSDPNVQADALVAAVEQAGYKARIER